MTITSEQHRLLNQSFEWSVHAHRNQLDKSGIPYIYHPTRIAAMASQLGLDVETQCIGLLHDVVEDTNITLDDLRTAKFPLRIIAGVDSMTRRNKKNRVGETDETYFDFVHRVALNSDARRVKLLDNADNMRPERKVQGLKLEERYEKAAKMLWKAELESGNPDWTFIERFGGIVTWV
jgi:(p)ppGpp synthase/HD superfamily hydrolase